MSRWALRSHDEIGAEIWYGSFHGYPARGASVLDALTFTDEQVETDLGRPISERLCGPLDEWVDLDGALPADVLTPPDDEPVPFNVRRAVYVASALPNRDVAREFARELEALGVLVTSTWHDTEATVAIEAALCDEEKATIAETCVAEIDAADTLVWLHGNAPGRLGAVWEYGYAFAKAKDVYLVSLDGLEVGTVFGALAPTETRETVLRALGGVTC